MYVCDPPSKFNVATSIFLSRVIYPKAFPKSKNYYAENYINICSAKREIFAHKHTYIQVKLNTSFFEVG